MRRALLAIVAAGALAAPARAEPTTLLLQPGSTVLGFRAYGLGMLPVDGQFGRFRGTLVLDAADPAFCRVEFEAEAASLAMPTKGMTEDALGPDARAEPTTLLLQPGSTVLGFRAYGFGMLPVDGQFGRFRGTLVLDAADPAFCRVEFEAEAASLAMPTKGMTEDALGPDLLNVAVHPRFAYAGACRGGAVEGSLTLGGVTKPFRAEVERGDGSFAATGMMRRADWGMGARPLMAGPEVRLRITTGLPAILR